MSKTTETRDAARARWARNRDKYNQARRQAGATDAEKKRRKRALRTLDKLIDPWSVQDYKDAQERPNILMANIEITMLIVEGYIESDPKRKGYFRQKRTKEPS